MCDANWTKAETGKELCYSGQKQGKNSAMLGSSRFYLPIRAVNFVHDLGNNDLLFNGVFEFLIFGVLVDLQVSSLEWLPNTTGEKQIL